MEFRFEAYDPDEIILISNFLMEMAKFKRKQQDLNRLQQHAIDPAQPPFNFQPPGSSVAQVMQGYSKSPFTDGG